jgi:hypothetical protein
MSKSRVTIISSEGRQTSANGAITNLFANYQPSGPIHLASIRMSSIQKIIEYASHHNYSASPISIPVPLSSHDFREVVKTDWDTAFFKSLHVENVIDMINACEILGYPQLASLCQAYLATLIKTMNIEELKIVFGVEKEFDEAETQSEYDKYMESLL